MIFNQILSMLQVLVRFIKLKRRFRFSCKDSISRVRESISTDIALVKPIAIRMFNLQGTSDEYFQEVEDKLTEETDYQLELEQSEIVRKQCELIPYLKFPKYYAEFSSDKIITMDWMNGIHLSEFCKSETMQEKRDKVGQTLWNFYMFQIHKLKKFHADPHPGNFLVDQEANLIVIDFGCMKAIPESFIHLILKFQHQVHFKMKRILKQN